MNELLLPSCLQHRRSSKEAPKGGHLHQLRFIPQVRLPHRLTKHVLLPTELPPDLARVECGIQTLLFQAQRV